MNAKTTIKNLRRYNDWRRNDYPSDPMNPILIDQTIDSAIELLKNHANEIEGLQNKHDCAIELAARAKADRYLLIMGIKNLITNDHAQA